jgi:hypothetical protein
VTLNPRRGPALALVVLVLSGCGAPAEPGTAAVPRAVGTAPADPAAPSVAPAVVDRAATLAEATQPRPDWLGTRVLERAADGFGVRLPTPSELVDRRLAPPPPHPSLPPPPADGSFEGSIAPIDGETAGRSTWRPECPVELEALRHVIVTFVGFDGRTHTGELMVHLDAAEDVVEVFRRLHAARFPLEEVRIIRADELTLPPTGDGNVTSGFVCRATVSGTSWSEHASGRAIDINPFHNPYVRGDLVLPELATAYLDRAHVRPGMVHADGVVVDAFAAIGWRWGGEWSRSVDWMHFSASGR